MDIIRDNHDILFPEIDEVNVPRFNPPPFDTRELELVRDIPEPLFPEMNPGYLMYKKRGDSDYACILDINPGYFTYKKVEECLQADDLTYFTEVFGSAYYEQDTLDKAGLYGAFQIIQFLTRDDMYTVISNDFLANLVKGGHINLFKEYLPNFPRHYHHTYKIPREIVKREDRKELLSYFLPHMRTDPRTGWNELVERGRLSENNVITECLSRDDLECAQMCIDNGCRPQMNTYYHLAETGRLDHLEWMLSNTNDNERESSKRYLKGSIKNAIKNGNLTYFITGMGLLGGFISTDIEYVTDIVGELCKWCFQIEHTNGCYRKENEWNNLLFSIPDEVLTKYKSMQQFVAYRKEKKKLQDIYVREILPLYIEKDVCKYIVELYLS